MQTQEINRFCYWTFKEKYYSRYYSCSDILLSDILTKKLEGEETNIEDDEMIKDWDVKPNCLNSTNLYFQKRWKTIST